MSRDEEKFNELINFMGCLTITGDELLELTGKIMEYGNMRADLSCLSTLAELDKEIIAFIKGEQEKNTHEWDEGFLHALYTLQRSIEELKQKVKK